MKFNLFLILSLCLINFISLKRSKTKSNLKEVKTEDPILGMAEIEYTSKDDNTLVLNDEYVITQISWTKNGDYKFNYLFGVFEGANDPSFSDAIPIAMIKEEGKLNEVNVMDLNIDGSYKYIRYIPPNKNQTAITPIKLYGQAKSGTSGNKNFQVTNLPLVSIRTDNSAFPENKDQKLNCKVIIVNGGKIENNEQATINIRGKSTSMASDKKPYTIKFATKQQVLGLEGSYKKWTLIANFFDRALMRNALAFKISELMEFEYTPRCNPVDVILNGNYRGNYYLCDKMEIGKDRINIDRMETTDTAEPNLSGGYFLEIDGGQSFYGGKSYKSTKGIEWKVNEPKEDEITPEQVSYITGKFNQFETEVYSGVFDSMDLETYSKFFLVEEFCGDPDAVWSSFYVTKKRGDDKFYFGPVWDFDLGFDNDQRLTPTNEKPQFAFTYGASAGTMMDFTKKLVGYKTVMGSVQKTWEKLTSTVLNEKVLCDFIDQQTEKIKESAELNYMKWDNTVKENNPWGWGWGDFGGFGNGGFGGFGDGGFGGFGDGGFGGFGDGGFGGFGDGGFGGFGRNNEKFETAVSRLKDYVSKRFSSLNNLIKTAVTSAN